MPDDEIAREAWRREASHHTGHRNFRPHLRPRGANLIGLRCEQCFAEEFGLKVDLAPRIAGDGGKDLMLWSRPTGLLYRVDCKAAIYPKDLIVETSRCIPGTIYVLGKYFEDSDCCILLGWEWGAELRRSHPKDYGYGIVNYWKPCGLLQTISELHRLIGHHESLPMKSAG